MNLTVIIPAYNRLADLLMCLNSIQAFAARPHRYVVQDDASPDYHAPAVLHPAQASVARNATNLGFAANVNAAIERASAMNIPSDVYLILNQDCYGVTGWSEGWDAAIERAFEDPDVGIVGARLLFPDGKVQSAGGSFDAKKQPFHHDLGASNPHHWRVNTAREVAWVTGAALAIRRSLWEQIGGFDPVYGRGYFEDVALCCTARAAGAKVWYAPEATFIHRVGTTGGNPHFADNARTFRDQWSSQIVSDVPAVMVNYW